MPARDRVTGVRLTQTTLAAGAVFTSNWYDAEISGAQFVIAYSYSDQASGVNGFQIQGCDDAVSVTGLNTPNANLIRTYSQVTALAGAMTSLTAAIQNRFWRIVYTNGGAAQSTFVLNARSDANVSQIQGLVAAGSPAAGNPVPVAGIDSTGTSREVLTDSTGKILVDLATEADLTGFSDEVQSRRSLEDIKQILNQILRAVVQLKDAGPMDLGFLPQDEKGGVMEQ